MSKTKIVGILNVTPDSFSDGGKFDSLDSAISQLKKMLEEGADVIDVGAESTRPQATPITAIEEWRRLEKILPAVIFEVKNFNEKFGKKIQTSIDSYHFETVKKSHELGVEIINDVSGLIDEKIVEFIAAKNITTILMHNVAIHTNPDLIVNQHLNVTQEILNWAREKISALEKKGVKKSQLIFDVGIGFGKNAQQSIRILKNIDAFRVLGLPLYVGHSKKSFLDAVKIAGDRTQKTLKISKFLAEKNVEFLRLHEVKIHRDAVRACLKNSKQALKPS
jgi:dihydropteroate synthase